MDRTEYHKVIESDLFKSAPVVIFIRKYMPDGPIEAVTGNIESIYGYPKSHFFSDTFVYHELIHPDDRERFLEENRRTPATESLKYHPYRFKDGRGVYRWVQETVVPIRDGRKITGYASYVSDITEDEEAYKKLVRSKEMFNSAQKIAKTGSWSLDLATNHLEWSDEIFNIFEIDKEEFDPSYEGFLNAIHPEDVESVQTAFGESVQNKTPYLITHRLLMADGRVKFVVEKGKTTYGKDGIPLYSEGTVQDITEIKELKEEIAHQHQELQTILNTTKDGIAILDMETNFLFFNQAFLKMSGFTEEELLRKNYISLSIPEDAGRAINVLEEVKKKGFVENFEKTCVFAEGKKIPVSMSIVLMPDQKRLLVSTKDISEAKRLEKKLKDYVALIDENILTSTTDLKGTITSASKAFCRISKYSAEELIGQNHRIIRHSDMPKELYEEIWKALDNDRTWEGEIKNRAKDGSAYWVRAVISPIWDDNGIKVGYTAIRQDITDKKRAEELSVTDRLTGLYNRLKIDEVIIYEIGQTKRYTTPLSIMLLDLDYFKAVNDTYGHQVGDLVLQELSNILRLNGRESDTIGRWGGEEFLIILPKTDIEGATQRAEKLRIAIESHDFPIVGKKTASFGVAEIGPDDTDNSFIERADQALYRAKHEGRNRVVR